MKKPDKRDEIVRAALELITEHGFHGAPMAMIAERAGVGAGTIYRYFENKDVLIVELFSAMEGRILAAVMEGFTPDGSVRGRFLHLGGAFVRYCIANPVDFRYLEQFRNSPYGAARRREKFSGKRNGRISVYFELFDEGIRQGVVKDLPLVVIFDLAFGPLIAMVRDHILGLLALDEDLVARSVEACWDGIRR